MGWYQVVKTINGRQYLYLQMTYRQGGKVKTKNKYLGPASGGFGTGAPASLPIASEGKPIKAKSPRRSSGLKIDPIIRWNDLNADQQKRHMRNSLRRKKADYRRVRMAKLNPEERAAFLENESIERERRRELRKAEKEKPPPRPTLFDSLNNLFKRRT